MTKKALVLTAAVLLTAALLAAFYLTQKTFGKHVDPSDVDHINVFDGNTGVGFTIDRPEEIQYIVENLQSHPVKRTGISLGRMGYSLKISFIDSSDQDVIPVFILNSDDTIRKDPFFYGCDGGLCFDYIRKIEAQSASSTTGFAGQ